MDTLNIDTAKYKKGPSGENSIKVILVGESGIVLSVPLDPANRHYAEIMRQVEAGTLTIAPANEE
jgi:hypothetical protein